MMQHVATAKSEIAAFATASEANSNAISGSNAQFGQFLQEQNAPTSVVVKSKQRSADSASKPSLPSPSEDVKNSAPLVDEQPIATQHKNAVREPEKADHGATSTSSQDKHTTATVDEIVVKEQSTKSNGGKENGGKEANDVMPRAVPESITHTTQNDEKLADGSSTIVAEEWVLLIDNLKRLTNSSGSTKSSLEQLDNSAIDLELADKVDKQLLEQITETSLVEHAKISLDGFKLPRLEDSKDPNGGAVISKKQVEQTMSDINGLEKGIDDDLVLVTNTQAEQKLAKLVDQALFEVLANADLEELPKAEIAEETAKLLLQQPDVMQQLMSQMNGTSQESAVLEQNSLETTLNNVTKNDLELVNQKQENVTQVDLTLDENIDLLNTLMLEIKVDTTGKLVQSQQAEAGINKDEPVMDANELLAQEIQTMQAATNSQSNVNKTDKAVTNNDIINLLNLPANKLDKVLGNIADRVFERNNVDAAISPEQIAQQVVTPKTTEIINSIESSSKEFVAVLKSGLLEFKKQLSKGREPGIDLEALVAAALVKSTDSASATTAKTPVNQEQIVNSVSQVLNLSQLMHRTIEERHDQLYNATLKDAVQIQGEQSKQIQLSQVESKFEKAINIAKPEGHQLLAEKVRWMVNTKNLVAEIRLDPAELGSVHAKVAISGESATVNFVVQSQHAKDAVDSATPRLRELLAEKGIELGQSSVREESEGQQDQDEFAGQGGRGTDDPENIEASEQVLAQQNIVNGALGGIDYFV